MLKRLLKNEKGLTLIELLAVVVILGIIAAIAVPAIGNIIEDSNKKAEVSDALQIINAAKIAKAAHPTATKFVANGQKGDTVADGVDLDDYLDSSADATVTFDETDGWTISGHAGLSSIKITTDQTEQDLTGYLDGSTDFPE